MTNYQAIFHPHNLKYQLQTDRLTNFKVIFSFLHVKYMYVCMIIVVHVHRKTYGGYGKGWGRAIAEKLTCHVLFIHS